jgi:hypothetical protein
MYFVIIILLILLILCMIIDNKVEKFSNKECSERQIDNQIFDYNVNLLNKNRYF